jgi:hypothetical protein
MLTDGDRERMRADLAAVRGDREVTVSLRRGGATLAGQRVRVARRGVGGATEVAGVSSAMVAPVTVLGGVDLDIAPRDRFTVDGVLFVVVSVHPNRDVAVMAEAKQVE